MHATNLQTLSSGRAVILADAGSDRYRLWQLVRTIPSARDRLALLVDTADAHELAEGLRDAASHVLRARQVFHRIGACLPCTLSTISADPQRQPSFVGLMPTPMEEVRNELTGGDLIEREFAPLFSLLSDRRSDYQNVVDALSRRGGNHDAMLDKLARLATLPKAG